MDDKENTVFISYRRSVSRFAARAIFQHLRHKGYDVFMDVESIDSGDFGKIILNQIAARAHFLVILSKGTLESVRESDDWLRKEIETALDLQRNVVPVLLSDFSFEEAKPYLTGKLAHLSKLNGLLVPDEYFEEAMARLCDRYLKQPVYGILSPTPLNEQKEVERKIEKAAEDSQISSSNIVGIQNELSESDLNLIMSLTADFRQPLSTIVGYCDVFLGGTVGTLDDAQMIDWRESKDLTIQFAARIDKINESFILSNFEEVPLHIQEVFSLLDNLDKKIKQLSSEEEKFPDPLQIKFLGRISKMIEKTNAVLNDFVKATNFFPKE